jgi:Fe-S cluster assembly protein SufD
MNSSTQHRQWFEQMIGYQNKVAGESGLPWLQKLRQQAAAALAHMPLPERRQEQWRYSALDRLLQTQFIPAANEFVAMQEEDIEQWVLEKSSAYRVVFANGQFIPALQNFSVLPDGVIIGSLRQALSLHPEILTIWFGQTANHTDDVFTALNTALSNDGLLVYLKRGVVLDRPIEVQYLNVELDHPQLIQPRNLIVLEQGAQVQLVERYGRTDDSVYFFNAMSEILLEQDAVLRHICIQEQSDHAFHLQRNYLAQAAHSQYQRTAVAIGGQWARDDLEVRFLAEQAECMTLGLYLVGDAQMVDQHLNIQHNHPANRSNHHYKGLLYGKGHGVFDGRIRVAQDAQDTNARLVNNNLLLCDDAEIDSKPQLEIFADNVICSHGATITQLDEQQLFYLRSRGIDATTAMQMISLGFVSEILEHLDNAEIRTYLDKRIQHLLTAHNTTAQEQIHA